MQSRRDQVQAVRFVGRRIATAVLGADPNSRDQPIVRQFRSGIASVLIGAIVVAGVTVWGFIRPGRANNWRDGGGLVVERETGTRYLYRDGALYPVLNYASALLLLGNADPPTRKVSRASLHAAPRGQPVGIAGAPESLPNAGDLLYGAWQVCARSGRAPDGTTRAALTLTVTDAPADNRLPPATDDALLVRGPSGATDMVWHGQRFRFGSPAVLSQLGYAAVSPVPVGDGWLNLLRRGPDLKAIPLARVGEPAPQDVDGQPARIGQVFTTGGVAAQPQFFLLTSTGLVAVSPLQAAVQLAAPTTADAYPDRSPIPIRMSASAAAGARLAADPSVPATAPRAVAVDPQRSAVCLDLTESATAAPQPYLQAVLGPLPLASAKVPVDAYGAPVADHASVPPGRAVVVVAQSEPTHTDGAWYLVTDLGVRYPLGVDALDALGYGGVTPVRLPDAVVSLFPTGPRLDRADAEQLHPIVPQQPVPQAAALTRVPALTGTGVDLR